MIPDWIKEIYLYALSGYNLNGLQIYIDSRGQLWPEKKMFKEIRLGKYLSLQEYIDGLQK
ncbi:hypothetical protein LCGC14_1719120 [marine sediment metagenome]|uniref:Uncharacterized protein n=1 Tax=marine sediment metagenome TaxID=412755 RepID=A0A0F9JTG4_9ZZZZ